MFNFQNNFRRRVFFEHEHGALAVRIERHKERMMYRFLLIVFTGAFLFFFSTLTRPLLRDFSATTFFALLPFIAFILVWYITALRIGLWRSFGIERIVVQHGIFQWNRTALFWKRNVELPTTEISQVKAVTPWHGLSNRVEVTIGSKQQTIGDMLPRDEAAELANRLRNAIGLP
jgi:membrane protease YdiL (CAAX protease family)